MTPWVIRAGKHGENEQWNLDRGRAMIRWQEIGDFSGAGSRDDVRSMVDAPTPPTALTAAPTTRGSCGHSAH